MSSRGTLTAINRNGINRVRDVSVLRKASFEETTDILFGAAVFSELDELKGVSERIIFGESVKIGTRSFDVMIDRDIVQNYNAKGKKDREQETDDKEDLLNAYNPDKDGWKTPVGFETPHGRNSMHMMKSPLNASVYGGGISPGFQTPVYNYSQREFSQHIVEDMPSLSPMPHQTPLNINYVPTTPLIGHSLISPVYNSGSIMHKPLGRTSNYRSPLYPQSNSPIYSSAYRSHSPDYNSNRINNSPNYTPTPIDNNREFKHEEDADDEDDD